MIDQSLLGPVVRMRWISNLLRLAILEESDQLRAAAGEYTEHDAEIRRLRRASMAPHAGRYYPVEGKANRLFKRLDPEQARQILHLWRTRQPLPQYDDAPEDRFLEVGQHDDYCDNDDPETGVESQRQTVSLNTTCSERSRRESETPNTLSYDDPIDELGDDQDQLSDEPKERWRQSFSILRHVNFPPSLCPSVSPSAAQPQVPPLISGNRAQSTRNVDGAQGGSSSTHSFNFAQEPRSKGPPSHHPLIGPRARQTVIGKSRVARLFTVAVVALLGALLIAAAAWFIKARMPTNSPQPPPALSERSESNGSNQSQPAAFTGGQNTKHKIPRHLRPPAR